jgi:hypothetical protein
MPLTGRRIACEICGLGYSEREWWENLGYCPNCDQPYGPNARKLLAVPRTDLDLEEDATKNVVDAPTEKVE